MEAANLRLFQAVGKRLGLLKRDLKVIFSGFPLTSRRRGDTRDRVGEAVNWPEGYCSSLEQITNKWIKLCGLPSLAEHGETLNHQREHKP